MANAQDRLRAGKPIGKVSTNGNLIVLELEEGVLGQEHLFDLTGRTLRFTPGPNGYHVENVPLQWDSDFGNETSDAEVTLHKFQFPFAGKHWSSFSAGANGSIRFGEPERQAGAPRREFPGSGSFRFGGVSIGRFDQLSEAPGTLINSVSGICVFLKPRFSGKGYVKELDDHVLVTWDVTEPWGNIQDFTWTKTVNQFQAVLFRNGTIGMSYKELAAKDAIVGVFPIVTNAAERSFATLTNKQRSGAPGYLDLRKVTVADVDGVFLKVNFQTAASALQEGDPNLSGIAYRVHFKPWDTSASGQSDVVWTVRGFAPRQRGGGTSRYFAFGPGLSRDVKTSGNTISIQGILPPALRGLVQVEVSAAAFEPGDSSNPASQIAGGRVKLSAIRSPEVEFSKLKQGDGAFPVVYESFHYYALPNPRDLTCSVIKTLGDKFDFLAYYSDFRVDNQEAGTPSNGPRGGNVTGIGPKQGDLESYCSQGRFQWQFIQPVYVGSNQMQEYPPPDAPMGNDHDVTFYTHQIGERTPDGRLLPYDYAMSQIGHEMGHRWGADATAKVNGETIELGPVHWARGLEAPAVFPYQRPVEASAMGGGYWQDNLDGTFTQLDDDYYVPAMGWSHLDLYLMGMISASEVPDFFILRNLTPTGKKDADGHPIFKADRTKITIQDVIAAEGPRSPDVDHAQKKFNTGFVLVVQHGQSPSKELIERTNGIRNAWIDYWATTTGHRSSMTADAQ